MAKLAIHGGPPVRTENWPAWPEIGDREAELVDQVVRSGMWSYNGRFENEFRKKWAEFIGTAYAVAAANGTVTLQLALEALDIGCGDEVIVPGLTWQATAASVIDVSAIAVLVDVDPESWCLDPSAFEAAVTPRTRAVIPVHLYGSICDMDAIGEIAGKHGIRVVEDCAHQHGSVYRGKKVGAIGDVGSFSHQQSKVLTSGEGGSLTTDSPELAARLDALRNCGRRPEFDIAGDRGAGSYGSEGDFIQSGNYRITEFQAAMLLAQLERLPEQTERRDRNAIHLNRILSQIPGITPMKRTEGTELQAYFNFAFRYDAEAFGGAPIQKFRNALSSELGFMFEACYEPLSDCSLYRPLTKKRYNLSPDHWKAVDPSRFELPNSRGAWAEESVCVHHKVLMGSTGDVEQIAEAIHKIRENIDEVR